jgi:protein-disulfide isomerase
MINRKTQITLFIIAVAVALILGGRFALPYFQKKTVEIKNPERVKGNPQSPMKIVEFIDFQCPACAMGALFLKEAIDQYPNQIFLEMKYFPLPMHAHAYTAARYAECAAREKKFWPFQDLLIARQNQWKRLIDAAPAFVQIGQEIGLDMTQVAACVKEESVTAAIINDKAEGEKLGVQSTPTYFVNGEMIVGAPDLMKRINKDVGPVIQSTPKPL